MHDLKFEPVDYPHPKPGMGDVSSDDEIEDEVLECCVGDGCCFVRTDGVRTGNACRE